ncbi:hypothetical protein [Streptomyces tricolor]|uniref:hypothetical protein n=1 Tax=Streptomyces tricolor TaxID=68277 RepID=UPI0036E99F4B
MRVADTGGCTLTPHCVPTAGQGTSRSRSLVLARLQRAGRGLLRDTSARLAGTVRQTLADSTGPEQRAALCALVPDLEDEAR